jgi:hypothetical protein
MTSSIAIAPGSNVKELFRAAYANRYTWEPGFKGYRGICSWMQGDRQEQGNFMVGADLKASIEAISDEEVHKALASQLWEVCIHRVRRPFEQTHAENTFTAGDSNDEGLEVIVGGKAAGDRYRIKNNVVTMVHRHIHGTVVTIHTESTTDTGNGYLSRSYTSQYSDPATGASRGGSNHFTDTFTALSGDGSWVLSERQIRTSSEGKEELQIFRFSDLQINADSDA